MRRAISGATKNAVKEPHVRGWTEEGKEWLFGLRPALSNGAANGGRSLIRLVDVYDDLPPAVEFLYLLLAERKVSESISHKRHPSFSEHYKFVQSKPYLGWYLIKDDNELLGTCYITHYREVGIWLMPTAKGKGAGKAAISQLLSMYPGRVFTNTAIHNGGAKAFYERMGFRHCANMLECDNVDFWDVNARSSDNPGKAEQQQVAKEGSAADRWVASFSLDTEGSEGCGNG